VRALVTGGAGFIGSHIVDALRARGDNVLVLDALEPTVHAEPPSYLARNASFIQGDVRDEQALARVFAAPVDVVFHEAAVVGVGNGDVDRDRFFDVNVSGTHKLIEAMSASSSRPRLVLASSMAVYGEGAYRCPACNVARPGVRTAQQLSAKEWEPRCPTCTTILAPHAVEENHPLAPETAYARSKLAQEQDAFRLGRKAGIPVVALRYHNVYGPRMPRNTPYAGVASLLKARVLAGKPPLVHEDGRQLRDFVHVTDVAAANVLAATASKTKVDQQAFNVGSGAPTTILALARVLAGAVAGSKSIELPGSFRAGDARHVFGSIEKAKSILGYAPRVNFEAGFRAFVNDPMRAPALGRGPV
jgi:dTDP-L-rhamnose 4-epimerase